jgi:hypothetical protein
VVGRSGGCTAHGFLFLCRWLEEISQLTGLISCSFPSNQLTRDVNASRLATHVRPMSNHFNGNMVATILTVTAQKDHIIFSKFKRP